MGLSRNTVKRYCQGENVPWESNHGSTNGRLPDQSKK
ncbi:hypothetical protein [Desulfallas sp. Bu1-1]